MKCKTRIALPTLVFGVALAASIAVPALAKQPGFSQELGPFQSNVTIAGGSKDSWGSANAYVQVNSDADGANFWVDQGSVGNRITDSHNVYPGSGGTLAYYSSGWTGSAFLRGCSIGWGPSSFHTAGWVNFDS